ncbi:transcription initiation factor TFIID subunit 3 [Strongylocentrotus purpuratus]|uniref:PHD-type domain-containing protein n=1 Tax=Strongylocentrotus purpuratus TaxID=7668 RepID=A0A7M7MZZ9_STRPU|nr:transcription initiation factor TFIID subunit 3 [Strongylocentrotus purpuratus]XP_030828975.1 transcription initiation factor TFIID subunit 3 [Strongylocentrotus purpuratus]
MADGFCQALLRISMAQICQELGWHSIHSTPCDLLTDVLQRYIQQLATVSHCYAEQYGRTEPNVDDLGLTFRQMGVSLYELENYIRDVDPIPFKHDIPQFPLRRQNDLQHPKPGSRDDRERLQYIPAHLPPIIGLSDDFGAPIGHHRDSIMSVSMDTDSPESRLISPMGGSHTSPRGEKRDTSSPLFSDQAMKRLRLDGDGTPQELTAVLIGIGGELTPKREGKLPIATTPPQRVLKAALGGDGTPIRANKAITDGLLNRSEETIVDRLQQKSPKGVKKTTAEPKSPKSAKPAATPKQKTQTKSSMFSPSSKYPIVKSKTSGTPGIGDKAGEFLFPPPKSPKLSSSANKKQQEKLQEAVKKEKTVPSVYDFDDDEFDSKPSKDPTLSPSDAKGSFNDPLSLDADIEQSKNPSQNSDSYRGKSDVVAKAKQDRDRSLSPLSENLLKSKKPEKDKKKLGSKDKSKIKHKLKSKKSKDDVQSYYDSVGSSDKKHTTPKAVKRKNSSSTDGKTPKLVIKTERKTSGNDEMRVIKKKFKKVKEKDKQKQLKVKKLKQKSIDIKIKSKASKHGIAPSSMKPQEDSSPEKRLPIGKLSLIKSAGSKLQFKIAVPQSEKKDVVKEKSRKPDKAKISDKEKPKVKRLKTSSSELDSSDREKKSSKDKKKTPISKDKKKESFKKDKEEVVSTPTIPKITFKLGAAPAGGDTPKIVIKTTTAPPPSVSTPTVPKLSISVPSKKSKDTSKSSSKSVASPKTEPKSKGESKTKTDSKPKAESSKKEKVETKPKAETKSSKTSKKIEKEPERETEKVEKEKKVKEKPIKIKVDTKPKAEVSPYDFDAPSPPPPTIKVKKESSSTPARKEPVPGIFAPSVPSPPPSKSSSPATPRSSSRAAAPSSPAPQKSKQKASTPAPTPPPTKAALKALPPSATKGSKASKQKDKKKVTQKQKAAPPPPPPEPEPEPEPEPPKPKADGPCILIAETAGTVVNEDGEKIWYCPACKKADDGVLPMIGCDTCDDWYHWECVGITEEPSTNDWYCKRCQNKSKGKKKKGRKN